MTEENTQEVVDNAEENKQEEPQKEEELFTKEQVNEIVKGRLAKERRKYEKFDEYKQNAEKNVGLDEQLQRVSKELEELKLEKSINEWKLKASEETGIDPKILRGSTEEEIMEHAQAIKSTISYPEIKQGANPVGESYKPSPHEALEKGLERGNWGFK